MASNLQRVGTSLLDMDGIATQLHIKGVLTGVDTLSGEEQYSPFITVKDITTAGSSKAIIQYIGVDSDNTPLAVSNIAIAYKDSLTSAIDRTTVRNAKFIDEHSPDYFFPAESGVSINDESKNLVEVFNKEIADIRAEHIQLMSYVAKYGLTEHYRPWAGFYDTFRENFPLHEIECLGTARVNSTSRSVVEISTSDIGNFAEGDYVVAVNGNDITNKNHRSITTIKRIDGQRITFNKPVSFDIRQHQTHLYKSYGTLYNNSFVFGAFLEQAPGDSVFYTGVDDDNYRTYRRIAVSHTGFATTFRVNPSRANGTATYYLDNIEISVKKTGTPGALKCYVINAADINNFQSPEQAKRTNILVAESQPLVCDAALGETIVQFDFKQDGSLPLLSNIDQGVDGDVGRTRFCMIIEALSADANNYYDMLFLQHYDAEKGTLSDLQMNNIVYEYSQQPSSDLTSLDLFKPLTTSTVINNSDMYYGVSLRSVIESSLDPASEGLYSAVFKTYEPVSVNNARLTLRVAREGYYTVAATSADENGNIAAEGTIRYQEDKAYRLADEQVYNRSGIAVATDTDEEDNNRKIAVGSNIIKVKSISGDTITIVNGGNVVVGDPVYPIGYVATLLCSCKKWNAATQKLTPVGTSVKVPLKLIAIQPALFDQEIKQTIKDIETDTSLQPSQRSRLRDKLLKSDNIVFEADIDNEQEYNCFELQIFWRTMASIVLKSFAGRIYDLSLSLNRKVFWNTTVADE